MIVHFQFILDLDYQLYISTELLRSKIVPCVIVSELYVVIYYVLALLTRTALIEIILPSHKESDY